MLENAAPDPTAGVWVDRGRVNTAHAGIDGTTFEYNGQRYFAYSPYVGPDSVISISRMTNPSTLAGGETIIARPDLDGERHGGRQILEGPEFLQGPDGSLQFGEPQKAVCYRLFRDVCQYDEILA